MVSRKKNIITSIIGIIFFSVGMLLFLYSFTFQRKSIIFLNDDGSVIAKVPTAVGKSRTLTQNFTSKELDIPLGYEAQFTGWDVPGTLQKVFTVDMKEEKDLTVKATYKIVKSQYKIVYSAINAAFSATENKKKNLNFNIDTADFELPRPTHLLEGNGTNNNGYTFIGWNIRHTEEAERLFTFKGQTYFRNIDFDAVWEKNEYSLKFYDSDEKIINTSNKVTQFNRGDVYYGYHSQYGIDKLPIPTKKGYKFVGWYSSSDYSGERISSIEIGTTGDLALYAKWDPIEYDITYNLGEATFEEGTTIVNKFTVESNFELPTPVKEGYKFVGWDVSETAIKEAWKSIPLGTIGNITLIAKFEEE